MLVQPEMQPQTAVQLLKHNCRRSRKQLETPLKQKLPQGRKKNRSLSSLRSFRVVGQMNRSCGLR